jgi:2-oxoacid:acceptor oxidoreductase delta subunit (pyruvate/2-ketoisovalerate family)
VPELSGWSELPLAGVVTPDGTRRPRTGSYRTGVRPEADLARCVDCLLCWLYCPDSAIFLDGPHFTGIDLDVCKGCEICAEVCPTGAIEMVAE